MGHHVIRRTRVFDFADWLRFYCMSIGKDCTSLWTMDETSGALADVHGLHSLAAAGDPVYGGAPLSAGSGTSIAFDGTGDAFSKTSTALGPAAGISATVLGLFKPAASVATRALIGHGTDTTWYALEIDATGHLRMLADDGSLQINAIQVGGDSNFDDTVALYAGVMDRTANELRATKNGIDLNKQTWATELAVRGAGAFKIGGACVAGTSTFLGDADCVAYIPHALAAAELAHIWAVAQDPTAA